MANRLSPVFVDLVLDNGGLIRVNCPGRYEDELHDSLNDARARGDWWSPVQFEGCQATFLGMLLDRVNMARVVATL